MEWYNSRQTCLAVMKIASELIRLKYPYFTEMQVPRIGVGRALNKAIDLCNAWKMDKKYRLEIYSSLKRCFSTYDDAAYVIVKE